MFFHPSDDDALLRIPSVINIELTIRSLYTVEVVIRRLSKSRHNSKKQFLDLQKELNRKNTRYQSPPERRNCTHETPCWAGLETPVVVNLVLCRGKGVRCFLVELCPAWGSDGEAPLSHEVVGDFRYAGLGGLVAGWRELRHVSRVLVTCVWFFSVFVRTSFDWWLVLNFIQSPNQHVDGFL